MSSRDESGSPSPVRAWHEVPAGYVIQLAGELNLDNVPKMRRALISLASEHRPARMVLDLHQVPYMDSSALAVLVEVVGKLRTWGGKLVLFGLHPRVQGLLEITHLGSLFVIAADEDAALKA